MRHAFRRLVASPGFTATALLTLALGIGVNTTAFSVLNALMLHTVPYPQPAELVRVFRTSPHATRWPHSPANFRDQRALNRVFTGMAAFQWTNFNLAQPGRPADRLRGQLVSANFLDVLRAAPALGRAFAAGEDQPGRDDVVVLSHGTWLERFGGDPNVLGRQIRLNGEPATIIGVMPAAFDDFPVWGDVGAWRPLALTDATWNDRENNYLNVIARLKPEVSLRHAQAGMDALARQLATTYPKTNAGDGLRLVELGRSFQDDVGRGITWLVMGLAAFVLLIACANLANLQFARNAARAREHAIRAALGATRARLIADVLAESVLLSLAGGALGLVLALWSNDLVGQFMLLGEHTLPIALDGRVLVFTLAASTLTGIGFGLLPAWLASRANVSDTLKQGGRAATPCRSHHRVRHALIVAEVALALVLLAGAGFFLRSLQRFTQGDPGWRVDGLLTAYVNLRGERLAQPAARNAFFAQLDARLASLPGVERATIASSLPTWGFSTSVSLVAEGQPPPAPGQAPLATQALVTPGFFDTLGIRLVQGRAFTPQDNEHAPATVIVNETMARRLWPGQDPIGKRIGGADPFMGEPRTVVGVVADVRPVAFFGEPAGRFQIYRPLAQVEPWDFATIALRTRLAPEALTADLRRIVAEIDPDQALYQVAPLRQIVSRSLASVDVAAYTLVVFALLGVLLAAVGIYAVIANSVAQRTGEIGLRMALGAQMHDILALVVGQGLRLTLLGAAIGLAGAFALGRGLRTISAEFSGAHPALAVGITVFLVAVGTFAAWLPARRAVRVDPITALRAE